MAKKPEDHHQLTGWGVFLRVVLWLVVVPALMVMFVKLLLS